MKKYWHFLIHRLGWEPCSLVAIIHDANCKSGYGIEHNCCSWKAVLRCAQCGEERTL